MTTSEAMATGVAGGEPGLPLLRVDPETERLRESGQRTATLGRYLLVGLGAVTLGSGVGLVFAHRDVVAFAFLAFGLLLMVLGAVQHLFYLRSRAHWPDQVILFASGIEVLLHNGEIRAAEWTDPDLDLELHVRQARTGEGKDILLVWGMDSKVPPCSLTTEGFERLRTEVIARGLGLRETRRGYGRKEVQVYTVGPPAKRREHSPTEWGP
jgi:hypothetical protein